MSGCLLNLEYWIENTAAELEIIISNPLPFLIKIEDLRLWIDSEIEVETSPSSLSLPPREEPQQFLLLAVPRGVGEVIVKGYSARVFGISSNCTMAIPSNPRFLVLPALPLIHIKTKAIQSPTANVTMSDIMEHSDDQPAKLYDGER